MAVKLCKARLAKHEADLNACGKAVNKSAESMLGFTARNFA